MYCVPHKSSDFSALRRILNQMILLVAALALVAVAAVAADAGERRKGNRSHAAQQHMGYHKAKPALNVGGHRQDYRPAHYKNANNKNRNHVNRQNGPRHPSAYASSRGSGVMLASGGRVPEYSSRYRKNGHYDGHRRSARYGGRDYNHGRHHGGGSARYSGSALIISLSSSNDDQPVPQGYDEPRVVGECGANSYCTVRLGPYSNSPKIITLNASGKAIESAVQEMPTIDEPTSGDGDQVGETEAELKRRYGSK